MTLGLYDDSPQKRSAAAAELLAAGQRCVPYLDPTDSGCLNGGTIPDRCRNYDRALEETLSILDGVASRHQASSSSERNTAKDLLWRMLHNPAQDVFDLERDPAWRRSDGSLLKKRAVESLARLMSIPDILTREEAERRSIAHARGRRLTWCLLQNCAGDSMTSGCNYGSFVFDGSGGRLSFRFVRTDDDDNFGSGVKVDLIPDAPVEGVGLLRARGGFGGDRDRLVFFRLVPEQVPLCALVGAESERDLVRTYGTFVAVTPDGCRLLKKDAPLTLEDFTKSGGVADRSRPGHPPAGASPPPPPSYPPPSPRPPGS